MSHVRRVVITGISGITAFGNDWNTIKQRMLEYKNAVVYVPEWEIYDGLQSRLAAPVKDFKLPSHITKKKSRSMGRVAQMAVVATEQALADAQLLDSEYLKDGNAGVAYGSCTGSTEPVLAFGSMFMEKNTHSITAQTYIQMMPYTTAANISLYFGLQGRIIPSSTACTSGSQAIGYAYEAIKHGYQNIMIAGGAEELCPSEVAVFDTLFATSQNNTQPECTPRPFDLNRDGLVLGEGAGTLILEELEHAQKRGAKIYAEIVGFATNCDATHVTQPQSKTMQVCLAQALKQADISTDKIGYVCLHGTATERGDIAESHATYNIFANKPLVSSIKSYLGHTLGACGALESWFSIAMMNEGIFLPTINLETVDEHCAKLNYIQQSAVECTTDYVMNNNFAFGGVNTSLIFKKYTG
ncbi:3-oxoacyl-ACP synthase [Gallibacterium salpingitidis]|uniref:3-oxoacyl-ACP synthase n=1 Tax=Gallibacterium salpingitidis TaxID=505341 RepID=A0A1A7P1Y1_9PAST|nr:beta-ketoacyl-ACP synthase [Gallibacterium salpingitidis]OBW96447.1 3-oxoacyl-ACP synthase [Gallibacterium salpingitidis]OBX06460.1 3-oxoacyl-ACP synthase [Gallibacterium salpingitidis]OBX08913.1 3-oxoacyl-ACP synthase [Gallibacterium salpingitidis]WKS99398.1 beta-ketoacyl-ACP synthase [Gallibacterium salpingitidis]